MTDGCRRVFESPRVWHWEHSKHCLKEADDWCPTILADEHRYKTVKHVCPHGFTDWDDCPVCGH